jgi:phospholipid-translocating ATPase
VKSSTWAEVRAGQLVLLSKDEQVPADVLIISSSNPQGVVYVDTMALDGETNLK